MDGGCLAWAAWRDGWMESTCTARPKTQGRARALATAARDAQRPRIPWCCGANTGGSGVPFLGMAAVLPYAAGSGPGVGREARWAWAAAARLFLVSWEGACGAAAFPEALGQL